MTVYEAKSRIDERWRIVVEDIVGYAVHIGDKFTTEHPWGWVFFFVPTDRQLPRKREAFAIDRITGESIPVGTKGLEQAVHVLISWRSDLGKHDENQTRAD